MMADHACREKEGVDTVLWMTPSWRSVCMLAFLVLYLLIATRGQAEPLPLSRAIRLALTRGTATAMADADVQRAFAGYEEVRSNYIPQLFAGSGLGWTYGYPLTIQGSPPALFNVLAQSSVFNPSLSQMLKAAKIDWHSAEIQNKDQRVGVIQDVVLTYAELAKWESRLERLQQDETDAGKMEKAVTERVQAGVDSTVDLNKAKLTAARLRLHRLEARGSADVLRRHLSTLTGIPVASIELAPDTIPALPPVATEEDVSEKAITSSAAVTLADRHSLAEAMRTSGEHRAVYPSVDFSAQYARFSTFNNYTRYFPAGTFQRDNATIGFGIKIPLFSATQRARIQLADAALRKAKKEAEATRNQVAEDTLKLQRAAEQLEAARDVAQLEYQMAQSGLEAAQTRVGSETGTLHDLADARVQADEHFLLFQDADFEYRRARMNLLRATGELEKWALPNPAEK